MATPQQKLPPFEHVTMPVRKQLATQNYGAVGTETLNADDLLYALQVKTQLNLTLSMPSGAAAITPADPDFPYSCVGNLPTESNVYRQINRLDGRTAYLLKQQQDAGWDDPATTVSLPAANSTTGTVTATGSVSVHTYIPVSASEVDLNGIIDMQADGLDVTVAQDWLSMAQIAATLNLGTSSLTAVSGAAYWTGIMLKAPSVQTSNLETYMSMAHRVSYQQQDIGGKQTVVYKFLKGPDLRRVGLLVINGSTGFRDVGNALQLETITLNYGNSDTPINLPPGEWDVYNASPASRIGQPYFKRYSASSTFPQDWSPNGSGIYWYDGTKGLFGRDWIKTGAYTSESINITLSFGSSCPAGSKLFVILDRYTSPRASAV